MGRACNMNEEKRNEYSQPEASQKRPLRITRHTWEDNIKINLR
jgi:hypothetical protein